MSAATRNEHPVLDSSSATSMDPICDAHRLPVTVGYSTRSLLSSRNTPRISRVAASASRSFLTRWWSCRSIPLSCALSRWPSARSGRGLEAFLQLCALTANTVDTPGQSGNVAAGSELRHQTRACLADFEQNIRYSHDRARQSLDPTRDNNLGEAGADDRTTDQF